MSIRKRLDGITKISKDYMTITPPCPKSVKIELTPRCNYKCVYCGYSYRKDVRADMDLDLFKKITKEMKSLGVEEIGVFYIGESFVNSPLLIKAVKYLKQDLKIPYVFLTSNASLARKDVVEELMKLGLDSLKWSCNASTDEQFSKMMNVSTTFFQLAKENIKTAFEIRNKGYKTKLYASSIKYSDEQVSEMQPFLDEFVLPYVDEHYFLPLYTMGGAAKDAEHKLGLQPVAGNPGRCDSLVDPLPCWTAFTAGHVLSDGRLTACCMDAAGSWVMGDLKTEKFMDAWHSKKFQELRQAHLNKNILGTACEKCALVGN
jgi:hypothetical protein